MTPDEFKDLMMELRGNTVLRWLRGEIDEATLNFCMRSDVDYIRYLSPLAKCPLDNGSIICECPADHEA